MARGITDKLGYLGDHPPGSWPRARRLVHRALAPVERFLRIEAASGILLLIAAAIALVWANSPWRASYSALWQTPFGLRFGNIVFERDLGFWINDGLMTVFFFVVGLEIRRETHDGELSDARRAALPVAAAIGGMLAPALIYAALNQGRASLHGWGTPMATDIAFAVGVLALLGRRVPSPLRVLLLALAVIDDVGAILVIAVFYSSGTSMLGFAILSAGVLGVIALQMLGARRALAYAVPAVIAWVGAYRAGIHPTLAGVLIGFLTPPRAWFERHRFAESAHASVDAVRTWTADDDRSLRSHLADLDRARREAVSPIERLQGRFHGWVAFVIMPLFGLANAGVSLDNVSFAGDSLRVFLGVTLGLILGKPLGIVVLSSIAVRIGIAALPRGTNWFGVGIVGLVGGIGFTMALFIAELAFASGPLLDAAKVGILAASAGAAASGLGLGALLLRKKAASGGL